MKFILPIIFTCLFSFLQAQSSTVPYSCYASKQQHKSFKSLTDLRSDTIDLKHIDLNIDISNWAARVIYAKATIAFDAKLNNVNTIGLDLLHLNVDSVFRGNTPLNYNYNDTILRIALGTSLNASQSDEVIIYYSGTPIQNSNDWGGFYWNNTYAYNVGVSFVEDPHNYGRAWFPCLDNFVERSTYSFAIKTTDNRKAFCNGILTNEQDNLDNSKTWFWEMNQEIPSYLASMAVSDYETISMLFNGLQGASIPIELAARAADTANLKASFIHLPDALECYEANYAPYAFDRVGYCVTSFNAGAMEHATNITYMRNAINGNTSQETLMAHELSHHWWGNLITCSTASDMWINEGWASFSEALFIEHVYGKDAYKEYSRENHDKVLRLTSINDGGYYPVSGVPTDLTYSSTVYDKGADMAHTIRGILGEQVFESCIESFLTDYAFEEVNTALLANYLSSCSGQDLSSFFETWIEEPGFHHYSIKDIEIVSGNNGIHANGSVLQKLWETSIFTEYLPITITFYDESLNTESFTINTYGECSSFSFELSFTPVYYALDVEELIQDATVDKYAFVKNVGQNDFELGRVILDVQELTDSVFTHVTHHYIQPDDFITPINGLHISPNRYWSIGGVWDTAFKTNAIFKFNGSAVQSIGLLDNDLIQNSEDSLVLLYKQDPNDDWSIVDSFTINTQGSALNKVGYIEAYDVQLGDYALAIYDHNIPNTTATYSPCKYTGIYSVERLHKLVKIYPVPTEDYLKVSFIEKPKEHVVLKVNNILGKEVYKQRVNTEESELTIATKDWQNGTYIVSIHASSKLVYSTKIIVE